MQCSAAAAGGTLVPYMLEESAGWGLNIKALEQVVSSARTKGSAVRALVVINPGNPTGQCLSYDNMCELIQFCYQQRIALLADEVYQELSYRQDRSVACNIVYESSAECVVWLVLKKQAEHMYSILF